MDFNELKELISIIDKSSLSYIDLDLEGCHVELDKFEGERNGKNADKDIPSEVESKTKTEVVREEVTATKFEDKVNTQEKKEGRFIKSPIVGTFYSSPSPEKDSFVTVGSRVKKGDTVCIIESMKLMNEIESDFDGEIAEVLVEDGSVVEYGQELFRVI